jgi:hypothetical protein
MRKFVDRIAGREDPDDPAPQHAEPSVDAQQPAKRVNEYTASGGEPDADRELGPASGQSGARAVVANFSELGDHVSSVVQAANEAAKKIEEDARNLAERLRERTQKQAASTLDDARREAEKLLFEAERLRTEAENESKETRKRAETYAGDKRREAEAEAAGVMARAEQVAHARASAAEERYRALENNVELTEERLRQLAAGLFDTASRLEVLVERPVAHKDGEESASTPTEEGSLGEALAASVKRSESG